MSRIIVRRYKVALPDKVDKPESPIKVVIIGDLHNKIFGEGNEKLVDKIIREQPDLIFSVGDLTVVKPGKEVRLEIGLRLLKRLSMECPVYASLGNHEYRTKVYRDTYKGSYEKLKKGMDLYQVHLLEDERAAITVKGTRLTIYGYELPMDYYKKFIRRKISPDEIAISLGWSEENSYNMLLAHNPLFFESYAAWGADFTCSGHCHGGIIRLPFLGGVISPQAKLFPKYSCGLYKKDEQYLCTTAGLGTHSFIPRINNPAEFSVVEFN